VPQDRFLFANTTFLRDLGNDTTREANARIGRFERSVASFAGRLYYFDDASMGCEIDLSFLPRQIRWMKAEGRRLKGRDYGDRWRGQAFVLEDDGSGGHVIGAARGCIRVARRRRDCA
jgi:hypothetical protein